MRELGQVSDLALLPQGLFVSAWACWNGTGTAALLNSLNVSSLTDNATGDQTITWAKPFPDANYAVTGTCRGTTTTTGEGGLMGYFATGDAITEGAVRVYTSGAVNTKAQDSALVSIMAVSYPSTHIPELNLDPKASARELVTFWCNWSMSTATIAGQYNVSSLTDNAAGDQTLNFTRALRGTQYIASGMCREVGTASVGEALAVDLATAVAATAVRMSTGSYADGQVDTTLCTAIGLTDG